MRWIAILFVAACGSSPPPPKPPPPTAAPAPASPAGVFGCQRTSEAQQACTAQGEQCELEPPPEYWAWGPKGGAHCDDACMEQHMVEVRKRPIPACMCTCSEDYQSLVKSREDRPDPP